MLGHATELQASNQCNYTTVLQACNGLAGVQSTCRRAEVKGTALVASSAH